MNFNFIQLRERVLAAWQEYGPLLRRWIVTLAVVLVTVWGTWKYFFQPTTLRIAVGPPGSERELFVKKLAQTFVEANKPVRLRLVSVRDTAEAARLLDADKVHLAVVRSDEAAIGDARTLSILDRRAILLVARSPAKEVASTIAFPLVSDSLRDKRIVVASDTAGSNRKLIARLLALSGFDDLKLLTERPAGQIAAELAEGRIDVAVLVVDPAAASTRALLKDVSSALAGNMVIGAPPNPEALAAINRDVVIIHLPMGLFGGASRSLPAEKLTTIAITEEIVSDSEFSETIATHLVKALLESRGRLPAFQSTYEIEPPPQDALRRLMPHPGVALAVADKSTSFFETYSDQIWLGLFAVGLIGSSLAGLGSWLGLWRPAALDPTVTEMLALIAAIEQAVNVEEVDKLECRLREIAVAQLQSTGESNEIGPGHPSRWYPIADALASRRRELLRGR